MKDVQKGKKLMVFINKGTEAEPAYESIALATSHTLTLSADTTEVATKDNAGDGVTWNDAEINKMSWSVSSELLYGTGENGGQGFDLIMKFYLDHKKVELVFDNITAAAAKTGIADGADGYTPDLTSGSFKGYKGKAIITSLTLNAPVDDNASYTVEFTGCGELSEYTA